MPHSVLARLPLTIPTCGCANRSDGCTTTTVGTVPRRALGHSVHWECAEGVMLSARAMCVRAAAAEGGGLDRECAEFVMLCVRVVCEGLVTCCRVLALTCCHVLAIP